MLGKGSVPALGRKGWPAEFGLGDRLPHTATAGVGVRIDEFVGLSGLAGDLACRHDRLPMLSPTEASPVQEILGTPHKVAADQEELA